jgi:hypothetical protein
MGVVFKVGDVEEEDVSRSYTKQRGREYVAEQPEVTL